MLMLYNVNVKYILLLIDVVGYSYCILVPNNVNSQIDCVRPDVRTYVAYVRPCLSFIVYIFLKVIQRHST